MVSRNSRKLFKDEKVKKNFQERNFSRRPLRPKWLNCYKIIMCRLSCGVFWDLECVSVLCWNTAESTKPALTMCTSDYQKSKKKNQQKPPGKARARKEPKWSPQCNAVKRALLDLFYLNSFHAQFLAGCEANVTDTEFPKEKQAVLKASLPLALSAQRKACRHLFSFHCCHMD